MIRDRAVRSADHRFPEFRLRQYMRHEGCRRPPRRYARIPRFPSTLLCRPRGTDAQGGCQDGSHYPVRSHRSGLGKTRR